MTEEVSMYLRQLIDSTNGLHAIVICDRDGIPVLKMTASRSNLPDKATRPPFLHCFSSMTDVCSKIGYGENKTIIAFFDQVQIIQINKSPLLVTFIADPDACTGEITNMELDLQDLMDEIKSVTENEAPQP